MLTLKAKQILECNTSTQKNTMCIDYRAHRSISTHWLKWIVPSMAKWFWRNHQRVSCMPPNPQCHRMQSSWQRYHPYTLVHEHAHTWCIASWNSHWAHRSTQLEQWSHHQYIRDRELQVGRIPKRCSTNDSPRRSRGPDSKGLLGTPFGTNCGLQWFVHTAHLGYSRVWCVPGVERRRAKRLSQSCVCARSP